MKSHVAIRAAAFMAIAAVACARPVTTPTPAPVRVERAPLPLANPALPPVPVVHGPLAIKVVYPTPNQLIESADSNFIFGSVGSGDAGLRINGTLVPVWPNGSFMGYLPNPPATAPVYELVATNGVDAARLTHPVKIRPPAVRDTLQPDTTKRDTLIPAPAGLVALVGSPASAVNDTDRVFIGRPAPGTGQEYKWFLFSGTPVRVTAYKGDFARIELDSAAPIWIQKSDIQPQPQGFTPPARIASASQRVESAAEWVDLVVPTTSPPPWLSEETDRSISVLLYGTTAESAMSSLPIVGDEYVSGVSVATEPGRIRYTLDLNRAPYGYLAMWQNGSFVFRVRRPPKIADASSPLRGLTITVDPGHPPAGATGPTELHESEANLAVGLKVRDLLTAKGVNVVMTRTTSDPVELGLRPIISRRANAHAFVSIHLNAFPDGVNPFVHNGTTTYYFWPHSLLLGQLTQARLVPELGLRDIGTKFGNFAVIRGSWMPSILCEGAFLIMPDQEAALRTTQYQEAYARGIVAGLESYFGAVARGH